MLKNDQFESPSPTYKPTLEEITFDNIQFSTFDLSGYSQARRLWKDYIPEVNGLVFLVDATDRKRFSECKTELDALFASPGLINGPLLILGNKIDDLHAASEDELKYALGLDQVTTGKGLVKLDQGCFPVELYMSSVLKRQGYIEGFEWLSQYI
ncbi:uncharacterized protein SAPINGB_P003532 [Magnusiomyces paraingens]|uniref:GTP-binding protein SAR1 n=1 Tax=Magnusiomyces paraingens TaxID=2606893 RepID=A0A5E8BXA0_9ASCO|nr:uncharacterized protein SAPINGB_P003532 [Saprochaete ingens]VVT53355.1 unnamed protein product [Saprochaete ingens]